MFSKTPKIDKNALLEAIKSNCLRLKADHPESVMAIEFFEENVIPITSDKPDDINKLNQMYSALSAKIAAHKNRQEAKRSSGTIPSEATETKISAADKEERLESIKKSFFKQCDTAEVTDLMMWEKIYKYIKRESDTGAMPVSEVEAILNNSNQNTPKFSRFRHISTNLLIEFYKEALAYENASKLINRKINRMVLISEKDAIQTEISIHNRLAHERAERLIQLNEDIAWQLSQYRFLLEKEKSASLPKRLYSKVGTETDIGMEKLAIDFKTGRYMVTKSESNQPVFYQAAAYSSHDDEYKGGTESGISSEDENSESKESDEKKSTTADEAKKAPCLPDTKSQEVYNQFKMSRLKIVALIQSTSRSQQTSVEKKRDTSAKSSLKSPSITLALIEHEKLAKQLKHIDEKHNEYVKYKKILRRSLKLNKNNREDLAYWQTQTEPGLFNRGGTSITLGKETFRIPARIHKLMDIISQDHSDTASFLTAFNQARTTTKHSSMFFSFECIASSYRRPAAMGVYESKDIDSIKLRS